MLRPSHVLLIALCALPARAGAPMRHDARRRAEAASWVQQLLAGQVVRAASRITYLGEQAFAADALVDALAHRSSGKIFIAQGLMLLAAPEGERGLVTLARDDDPAIRLLAAQGLGRIRSRRADVLLLLVRDAQASVRREAAKSLGAIGDAKYGRALLDAAQTEGDLPARVAMLEAVGAAGDKRQASRLIPFVNGSSESAQWAAARALCLLGHPEGTHFATARLASTREEERRMAIELFDGVALRRIRSLLAPKLDDASPHVAAVAARVLAKAGDAQALHWLVKALDAASFETRPIYAQELEKLGLSDAQKQQAREHEAPLAPLDAKGATP